MSWTLRTVAVCLAAVGALTPMPSEAELRIGAIAQSEYTGATGTRAGGQEHDLVFRETVYANERVDTDAQSYTHMAFLDDTKLFVGGNSSVVLDRFVYDPDSGRGEAAVSLMKGAFRFVTGHIKTKENVTLRTPTASISVRGTVLVLFVLADGTSEINVWDGAADVLICERPDPVRVNRGESLVVSASCDSRRDRARDTGEVGYPIPRLPVEYAPPEDIAPAAGPTAPEQPETPTTLKRKHGTTGGDRGGGPKGGGRNY